VPDSTGNSIVWDEGEKFLGFDDWAEYLVEHFLKPWGYQLNGRIEWQGDDELDLGVLVFRNNVLDILGAIVVYEGEDEVRRLNAFLCYASEDRLRAKALASRLRDDNIEVWLDDRKLLPGSDWELEIVRALRSADAVILCLSTNSVRKRGFVQREVRMALTAAEEQPEGELFLFPVLFEPCAVPDGLRRYQWLDLKRRGSYGRLLTGLAARASSISTTRSHA
jgi:hypothetical protein